MYFSPSCLCYAKVSRLPGDRLEEIIIGDSLRSSEKGHCNNLCEPVQIKARWMPKDHEIVRRDKSSSIRRQKEDEIHRRGID